jgi:hypothetical protein
MELRTAALAAAAMMCFSPVRTNAQWEIAGYLGGAHTQNSNLHLQQPALGNNLHFRDVSYRGESFRSPLYYGGRGGYIFRKWIGAEIEFTHLKVFSNTDRNVFVSGAIAGRPVAQVAPMNMIVQRFSLSHGVNLLLANIALRHGIWRKRLSLTARAGVGTTIPHAESTILGITDEHYQVGRAAMQLAPGAELHLWRAMYWMGEYKYTRSDERVDVNKGTAGALLRTHRVVTGIAVRVGK